MVRPMALAAGLAVTLTATLPQAQAADFVGVFPDQDSICGHHQVLGSIRNDFRHQVAHVPNLPDVGIVDLYGVRRTHKEPSAFNSSIERLYCTGTVRLTSGEDRPIWYVIEYGQGFASFGDNVEFCVLGFDRWNVYNSACRVLR